MSLLNQVHGQRQSNATNHLFAQNTLDGYSPSASSCACYLSGPSLFVALLFPGMASLRLWLATSRPVLPAAQQAAAGLLGWPSWASVRRGELQWILKQLLCLLGLCLPTSAGYLAVLEESYCRAFCTHIRSVKLCCERDYFKARTQAALQECCCRPCPAAPYSDKLIPACVKLLKEARHTTGGQTRVAQRACLCSAGFGSHSLQFEITLETDSVSFPKDSPDSVCTYSSISASLHSVTLQFKDSVTASRL